MRYLKLTILAVLVSGFATRAYADDFARHYGDSPDIDIWTNKGDGDTYYYGEDVAVYFRAERDCYVVVYDIDPSGEVSVLFPSNYYNSAYVTGDKVYRIPDYYSDYTLEVSGRSGTEHVFAVASYDYLNTPDFMRYVGYDYGDTENYDNDYFVTYMRGNLDDFTNFVNNRIAKGPYSVAHTRFYVDTAYRHHRHYRYWDYDPYYIGSVWIGCDIPGAEIWIDGIYFGIAPLLIPRIYIGEHWLWAYYGGYPCYQRYFWVSNSERYYIDFHVDSHYKDYRYRRNAFGGWHPLEKKYRNEKDFKERARESRVASGVRTRSLPDHVIRDFDNRGIIKKDSPLAKQVRASVRTDDGVRALEKRRTRQEIEDRTRERDRSNEKDKRDISVPDRKIELQNRDRAKGTYEVVPTTRDKARDAGELRKVEKKAPEKTTVKRETTREKTRNTESVKEREQKSQQPSKSRMKKSNDSGRSRSGSGGSSGSRGSGSQSKKSSSGKGRRP